MNTELTPAPSQDARNLALLTWLGTLLFAFIPGLLVYLFKKDDPFLLDHAKEALNWSITALLGYILGAILTVILIGILLVGVVGVFHLAFCLMGAVSASNGRIFRAPFAIRLIK
jgi:uncharacterized Tic20 family protein